MEAIAGLVGVIVGALLAFTTELWKQRADSRSAATLILAELLHNRERLDELVKHRGRGPRGRSVRRLAWDTYGPALLRRADRQTLTRLITAYHAAELAETTISYFQEVEKADRHELEALRREAEAISENTPTPTRERVAAEIDSTFRSIKTVVENREAFLNAEVQPRLVPEISAAIQAIEKYTAFKERRSRNT